MQSIQVFINLVSLSQGGTGMVTLEEDQRFVIVWTFWSSEKFTESAAGVGFSSCPRASVAWFLSDKPGRTWPAVPIPILMPSHDKSQDLFFCSFIRDRVSGHIFIPRSNNSCPVVISPPCCISFSGLSLRGASAEHIFPDLSFWTSCPSYYFTDTCLFPSLHLSQFASINLWIVYLISVSFLHYSSRVQTYFVHCCSPIT